jgi:hypothetical protein
MIHAEPSSEPDDLPGHVLDRHGRDDWRGRPQSVDLPLGILKPATPPVHHRIGDDVSQRIRVGSHPGECAGPVLGEDLGRILASRQNDRRHIVSVWS